MQLPAILTTKFGPLPGWGWGLIAVGGAVAVSAIRGKSADAEQVAKPVTQQYDPASGQPTYVFQNYDQDVIYNNETPTQVPPAGGRQTPRPQPAPSGPIIGPLGRRQAPAPNRYPTDANGTIVMPRR